MKAGSSWNWIVTNAWHLFLVWPVHTLGFFVRLMQPVWKSRNDSFTQQHPGKLLARDQCPKLTLTTIMLFYYFIIILYYYYPLIIKKQTL